VWSSRARPADEGGRRLCGSTGELRAGGRQRTGRRRRTRFGAKADAGCWTPERQPTGSPSRGPWCQGKRTDASSGRVKECSVDPCEDTLPLENDERKKDEGVGIQG